MSDYIPSPNDPRDPLNRYPANQNRPYNYEPVGSSNGAYIVVGSMVVAVAVAGFLLFSGPPSADRIEQARLPFSSPPIERTLPGAPAPMQNAPTVITPAPAIPTQQQ